MKASVWGVTAGLFLLASAGALAHDHEYHQCGPGLADRTGVKQIAQQVVAEPEGKSVQDKLPAGAREETSGIAALK